MLCLLILFVFVTRLSILCLNGPQWDRQWETLKDDRYRYLWRKKFKTTCLYRYPWQRNSDIQTVWIVKTRVLMSKKILCIFNLLANICRREPSHSAHCRVLLRTATSDLDSWDSVDAKNGLTCQDWTKDTRDTEWVLKWVIVRIAAFCCTQQNTLKSDHRGLRNSKEKFMWWWWVGGCTNDYRDKRFHWNSFIVNSYWLLPIVQWNPTLSIWYIAVFRVCASCILWWLRLKSI